MGVLEMETEENTIDYNKDKRKRELFKEELKKNRDRIIANDKDYRRKLKFKKFVAISLVGITLTGTVTAGVIYSNSDYKIISSLESEIEIHSGYGYLGDKKINPFYDHGCAIGSSEEGSVEDRIISYCDDNNLSEETKNAAIQKFDLLYDDNVKEAEKIDLYEINKNFNKKNKGRSR